MEKGQKVQCNKCKDIIQSKHRHDFVTCKCGAIAIDGGSDYTKLSGNWEDIIFDEIEFKNSVC